MVIEIISLQAKNELKLNGLSSSYSLLPLRSERILQPGARLFYFSRKELCPQISACMQYRSTAQVIFMQYVRPL